MERQEVYNMLNECGLLFERLVMAKKQPAKAKPFGYTFGRPSKYKPEYCDLTDYLSHCQRNKVIPSNCALAIYLDVTTQTLDEWRGKHQDFSVSLKRLNKK